MVAQWPGWRHKETRRPPFNENHWQPNAHASPLFVLRIPNTDVVCVFDTHERRDTHTWRNQKQSHSSAAGQTDARSRPTLSGELPAAAVSRPPTGRNNKRAKEIRRDRHAASKEAAARSHRSAERQIQHTHPAADQQTQAPLAAKSLLPARCRKWASALTMKQTQSAADRSACQNITLDARRSIIMTISAETSQTAAAAAKDDPHLVGRGATEARAEQSRAVAGVFVASSLMPLFDSQCGRLLLTRLLLLQPSGLRASSRRRGRRLQPPDHQLAS